MYRRQRYFKNSLPDYSTSDQNGRNCDFVRDLIKTYMQRIVEKFKPLRIPRNADGGLYVGIPGVAFMFLKMARSEFFEDMRQELLRKAFTYIKVLSEELVLVMCTYLVFCPPPSPTHKNNVGNTCTHPPHVLP